MYERYSSTIVPTIVIGDEVFLGFSREHDRIVQTLEELGLLGEAPGEVDDSPHIDPVCGMEVIPSSAAATAERDGETYYFCNPRCLARFQADPESFLNPQPAPQVDAQQTVPQSTPATKP